jgi:hypothetical protein
MDRETILKSMLSGVSPALSDDQLKSIRAAMKAFSVKQLQKMDEAGVRIWPRERRAARIPSTQHTRFGSPGRIQSTIVDKSH